MPWVTVYWDNLQQKKDFPNWQEAVFFVLAHGLKDYKFIQ